MQAVVYDGSFKGWLTAVFDVYEHRFKSVQVYKEENGEQSMFGHVHHTGTEEAKAGRVWKGLQQKLSNRALQELYYAWLSELKGIETHMLLFVQYAFGSKASIENDYSHPSVLLISQVAKKVHREKHRMEAFVRFQLTTDQLYYAIIEPDFNVLPLISDHFEQRYADQRWMIYDARRRYGIYYDLEKVEMIEVSFQQDSLSGKDISAVYDEQETLYQHLWQSYFKSVNIASRKNTRLHIQHMPRRYWKYLPEKKPL
ncbi:MAG: TIGR03915 family putative DNA repair protein [Williamsia sp.]|nr:TIGR03915 family putative DNA repair protein [Williamsia sp.]